MRKHLITTTAALTLIGLFAAPASAHHQHQLTTPGTSVTFRCEPAAAADVHPIHNGLHMALKHNVPDAAPVSMAAIGSCDYS